MTHPEGRTWSMARIVVILALALMGFGLAAMIVISIPAFERIGAEARNAAAFARLRQLGAAAEAYASLHEGRLPPAETWIEELRTYVGNIDEIVRSPNDRDAGRIYAMNRSMGGQRLADVTLPAQTVMFFQVEPGSPPSGGPELLPIRAAEMNLYAVVYANGGVASVPLVEVARLVWEP